MDMVERVARAIWNEDSVRATGRDRRIDWSDAGPADHAKFASLARAAIAAMREPTDGMVQAGQEEWGPSVGTIMLSDLMRRTHRAMIDATLTSSEK